MKNKKLVCGVGITDSITREKGKQLQSYTIWNTMLQRCYSQKKQIKQPTYKGCSVCIEWLTYSNFKTWFDQNYVPDYQLDKDILTRGNKVYSPTNCRFVPRQINSLLIDRGAARGQYLQGVSWDKGAQKFKALCHIGTGTQKHIGVFELETEAFLAYKTFKENHIKQIANEYYNAGKIGIDIRDALLNWVI